MIWYEHKWQNMTFYLDCITHTWLARQKRSTSWNGGLLIDGDLAFGRYNEWVGICDKKIDWFVHFCEYSVDRIWWQSWNVNEL